jgi:hypothetical protein
LIGDKMAKYVWERLSGSQLIFAVNFITAFGIFFEGWNQGNMGFASASPEYQVSSSTSATTIICAMSLAS